MPDPGRTFARGAHASLRSRPAVRSVRGGRMATKDQRGPRVPAMLKDPSREVCWRALRIA
mgnify:CR=1 FL=1